MMTGPKTRTRGRAFTLTELLVVLGILVLAMGIVLPSMIPLLSSNSMTQARAMLSGLLGAARGLAIERQSYSLVHFQMSPDEKCWAAVLIYDTRKEIDGTPNPTFRQFIPAEGYPPRKMPGSLALGEVIDLWTVAPAGVHFEYIVDIPPGSGIPNPLFTTFNVIFAPDGSLAEQVPDAADNLGPPAIYADSPLFAGTADQTIWETSVLNMQPIQERGVRLMVAFNYKELKSLASGAYTDSNTREHYLEHNGLFFAINPYTGQLLPSE